MKDIRRPFNEKPQSMSGFYGDNSKELSSAIPTGKNIGTVDNFSFVTYAHSPTEAKEFDAVSQPRSSFKQTAGQKGELNNNIYNVSMKSPIGDSHESENTRVKRVPIPKSAKCSLMSPHFEDASNVKGVMVPSPVVPPRHSTPLEERDGVKNPIVPRHMQSALATRGSQDFKPEFNFCDPGQVRLNRKLRPEGSKMSIISQLKRRFSSQSRSHRNKSESYRVDLMQFPRLKDPVKSNIIAIRGDQEEEEEEAEGVECLAVRQRKISEESAGSTDFQGVDSMKFCPDEAVTPMTIGSLRRTISLTGDLYSKGTTDPLSLLPSATPLPKSKSNHTAVDSQSHTAVDSCKVAELHKSTRASISYHRHYFQAYGYPDHHLSKVATPTKKEPQKYCNTPTNTMDTFIRKRVQNRLCIAYRIEAASLSSPVDFCVLPDSCFVVADYDQGLIIFSPLGDICLRIVSPCDKNVCCVTCNPDEQPEITLYSLIFREASWIVNVYKNFSLEKSIRCPSDVQIESWALRKIGFVSGNSLYLMASGHTKVTIWLYEISSKVWRILATEGGRKSGYNDIFMRFERGSNLLDVLLTDWQKSQLCIVSFFAATLDLADQRSIKVKRIKGQEWIVQGPNLSIMDERGDIIIWDTSGKLFLFDGASHSCKKIIADIGRGEVCSLLAQRGWLYVLCRYRHCIEAFLYKEN